jgi:hypothetical protein
MSTPEGKVKDAIKKLLAEYKIQPASKAGDTSLESNGWYYMPIQSSMGVSGIPDFIGCYCPGDGDALFFGIEAKALGKTPSGFQLLQINAIKRAGGAVFVIDGEESLNEFKQWLEGV